MISDLLLSPAGSPGPASGGRAHRLLLTVLRILPLIALVLALALVAGASIVHADSGNLLQNPGFERPYISLPNKENCRIAQGWTAYWIQGIEAETSQGYRLAPEYKAAFRSDYPNNRVRNGELSQQYFHSFGNFQGGVYQRVNVPAGSRLRFSAWMMAWSCDKESKQNCPNATSGDPSPMHMRVGIDPRGGTDWQNPAIVWSTEKESYDQWSEYSVEAVAQGPAATVFVYSYPDFRSQDNNVYIDDASLIALGPAPKPTVARPATTTQPAKAPQPATIRPKAVLPAYSGVIYIMGPKDTLDSIAKRFGTNVAALRTLNGLSSASQGKAGLKLKIPKSGG